MTNKDLCADQKDDYRPNPDTSLELRINNALHRLNLDRPDIAALKDGESIQRPITDDRYLAALLIDLRSALKRESVKDVKNCLCFPTQVCNRSCGMWPEHD